MNVPKLRFREFHEEWEIKKLDEVGHFINGLTYSPMDIVDEGILVLRSSNVQNGNTSFQDNVFVNLEIDEDKFTQEKDILICVRNGSRNLIGKNTLIKNLPYKATHGDFITIFRGKSNDFVSQFFQTNIYYEFVYEDLGSTINSINNNKLKKYSFYFASKSEQTKIATFLSTVDEKIAQLSRKHELLQQYKQGMMQQLFSQKLRFKDDKGEDFPEWGQIKLKNFLSLESRPVNKPETNYHALGVRSHFKGLFNKIDSDPSKISMDTLYRVKKDDFVVNITFAWEGALAFAELEHDEGLVSHRFPTYRCDNSKVVLNFFKYRFTQMDFLTQVQLCSPGGAGRNRVLKKSDFLEIMIEQPPLEEQTKIANFLTAIDNKIDAVAKQLEQARVWKKGLLQQMFV